MTLVNIVSKAVSLPILGYEYQFDKLMCEFNHVYCSRPGWLKHRIETGSAKPVRKGPYKMSPSRRESLKVQIEEMLEMCIIEPSTSEWSSLVVMVPKQDGTCLEIDYRSLNAVTKPSNYPIPTIDSILYSMKQSKVYSTIDLKS